MNYGIKNVFRFYDQLAKQNRELDYVGGNTRTWQLLTDIYHVPAFQITIASDVTQASDVTVYLVNLSDDSETDISAYFTMAGLTTDDLYVQTFTSYNYLIYNRNQNLNTNLSLGGYYLKITSPTAYPAGITNYYSEIFTVKSLTGDLIVTYSDSADVDTIDYTNGDYSQFENKLIVPTVLQRPEWIIEEEGTEDGEGNFLATFQRLVKRYKFIFYAPEYILDALMLVPMCDTVTVVSENGETQEETLTVEDNTFKVTPEWTDTKGFAKVTCEFDVDAVIKTNCANNIT
jgi:hypothetical protein